jgi:hypothetical protein
MAESVADFDGMRNTWFRARIENRDGIKELWAVEVDIFDEPTGYAYRVRRSRVVAGIRFVTARSFGNE